MQVIFLHKLQDKFEEFSKNLSLNAGKVGLSSFPMMSLQLLSIIVAADWECDSKMYHNDVDMHYFLYSVSIDLVSTPYYESTKYGSPHARASVLIEFQVMRQGHRPKLKLFSKFLLLLISRQRIFPRWLMQFLLLLCHNKSPRRLI